MDAQIITRLDNELQKLQDIYKLVTPEVHQIDPEHRRSPAEELTNLTVALSAIFLVKPSRDYMEIKDEYSFLHYRSGIQMPTLAMTINLIRDILLFDNRYTPSKHMQFALRNITETPTNMYQL